MGPREAEEEKKDLVNARHSAGSKDPNTINGNTVFLHSGRNVYKAFSWAQTLIPNENQLELCPREP